MLSVADKQTVCGSKWTYLGNPATGPGADQTYGAQSTFVLPYVSPSTNKTTMVMMASAAPRGSLHAGRSTEAAPRGPLHSLQIFFCLLTCAHY